MSRLIVTALLSGSLLASALPWLPAPASATHNGPYDLFLYCDDNAGSIAWSMETQYRGTRCGTHLGIHQWFVGDRGVFRSSAGGEWHAKTREADASPTESGEQAVNIETSMDGITWTQRVRHVFTPTFGDLWVPADSGTLAPFPVDVEFRYLRMRLETSVEGGISGFVNGAYLYLKGSFVAASFTLPPAKSSYSCASDILEDIFASHTCWFGPHVWNYDPTLGIIFTGWYNAAGYHHTYPIETSSGARTLTRVQGTVKVAPYRATDHALQPYDRCPLSHLLPNVLSDPLEPVTDQVKVQISTNGREWITIQTIAVVYDVHLNQGEPQPFDSGIDVTLSSVPAKFVRVSSELAPCFDQTGGAERFDGYLLDSSVQITAA